MLETPTGAGPRDPALSAAAIRAQVERIMESEVFRQSERQRRFLRYIIDQSLNGNTGRLKGYTIGIDVFDRGENFDPTLDSIVRVEAGRLRSKLRDYYKDFGFEDRIIIDVPKGSYAPSISSARRRASAGGGRNSAAWPQEKSIAVIPFRSLSSDPAQEYFSDGMTDAVITALARNRSLKVISLTSVMRFKNTERPIPEIAEELGVSHILEGTVLRDANEVRVTAQLIEATSDHHVWTETFERELSGVLKMQAEVANVIAAQLAKEVAAAERKADWTIDPAAYDSHLLGMSYRKRLTREGFERAIECFRHAIDIDPACAPAYSGVASCYCGMGSYGFELEMPERIIPKGLEYSRRAMELDPDLVDPHTYMAIMTLKYAWDWREAERLFRKALRISPNDARAHLQYSLYFESIGRHEHAIKEAEHARHVDPLSTEVNMNLAWQLHQAGRQDEALARLNWTLDLNPDFWGVHWALGHVHLTLGQHRTAVDAFRRSVMAKGGYTIPLQGLGYALAVTGDRAGALEVIGRLDEIAGNAYVSPCHYAAIHAGLGETDRSFEFLEKAVELRSRSMAWLKVAKEFAGMRGDPRFQSLIRRIGIPEGHV
ncbi:MAG: tetratricopeptide repeat protein [Gammaproteobacteria bacterium]|nr:tetratricopeptide repeat protein [Gammaproteobacteria bacterium]